MSRGFLGWISWCVKILNVGGTFAAFQHARLCTEFTKEIESVAWIASGHWRFQQLPFTLNRPDLFFLQPYRNGFWDSHNLDPDICDPEIVLRSLSFHYSVTLAWDTQISADDTCPLGPSHIQVLFLEIHASPWSPIFLSLPPFLPPFFFPLPSPTHLFHNREKWCSEEYSGLPKPLAEQRVRKWPDTQLVFPDTLALISHKHFSCWLLELRFKGRYILLGCKVSLLKKWQS